MQVNSLASIPEIEVGTRVHSLIHACLRQVDGTETMQDQTWVSLIQRLLRDVKCKHVQFF